MYLNWSIVRVVSELFIEKRGRVEMGRKRERVEGPIASQIRLKLLRDKYRHELFGRSIA